jgi:hypothetical protein
MVTVLAALGTIFLALDHRSLLSCPTQLIKPFHAKAKSCETGLSDCGNLAG